MNPDDLKPKVTLEDGTAFIIEEWLCVKPPLGNVVKMPYATVDDIVRMFGIPASLFVSDTNYSSARADERQFLDTIHAKCSEWSRRWAEYQSQIMYIAYAELRDWDSNLRLAELFWIQEKAFEKSLSSLAQYHRLGPWRFLCANR